jgi:hypothetical protein
MKANAGQLRPTQVNDLTQANTGQHRLMAANECQHRPTTANEGQCRPTTATQANTSPQQLTMANKGQQQRMGGLRCDMPRASGMFLFLPFFPSLMIIYSIYIHSTLLAPHPSVFKPPHLYFQHPNTLQNPLLTPAMSLALNMHTSNLVHVFHSSGTPSTCF